MANNLKGFLSKFNSAEGLYVNTIDPLNTFDVCLSFYPMMNSGSNKKKSSWVRFRDKAEKNALNGMTGGLLGAIKNNDDIMNLKKTFKVGDAKTETTFVDYLARGNMLVSDDMKLGGAMEKSISPQLILDISYYVLDMLIPLIQIKDEGTIETIVSDFPVNGKIVKPTSNSFIMTIINTKASLIDRIFYPWMREVTLPYWVYQSQPYTTADISVDFSKHSDLKYVFVGCRPLLIENLRPSNELNTPTRTVTMIFDYMFILSKLDVCESALDKLKNLGKSALGSVSLQFGL